MRWHTGFMFGVALSVSFAAAASDARTGDKSHKDTAAAKPAAPATPPPEIVAGTLQVDAEPATLRIAAPATSATGTLVLHLTGDATWDATLRLSPELPSADVPRFLFEEPVEMERGALDLASVCHSKPDCAVHYKVADIWAPGTFRATATVQGHNGQTIATEPITIVRAARPAAPVVSGDAVSQQHITLDTFATDTFWLKLENPPASRMFAPVIITDLARVKGCPDQILTVTPVQKHLDPGAETLVQVTVAKCDAGDQEGLLEFTSDEPGSEPLIAYRLTIKRYGWWAHFSRDLLDGGRLPLVLLGAFVSLGLNNFFPFQRSRRKLSIILDRIEFRISSFSNLGSALADALEAETVSIRKALARPHFWDASKTDELRDVQTAIEDFDDRVGIALRIDAVQSEMLAKLDQFSVATSAAIRGNLLDAEDALLTADKDAANAALVETRMRFEAVFSDTQQTALRADVVKRLAPLAHTIAQHSATDTFIKAVITRLRRRLAGPPKDKPDAGYTVPADASLNDLLYIEQDVANLETWIHVAEPRVSHDPHRFGPFWCHLSDALERTPKCGRTRLMIEMFRADITPADLGGTLTSKGAEIVGDNSPQEFEITTYRVRLKDDVLGQLPLAHQFLNYAWTFDDETVTPSHAYCCRHFFVRRKKRPHGGNPDEFSARVVVTTPFAEGKAHAEMTIKPHPRSGDFGYAMMETVSFSIFTLIAIISAYKTQYATSATSLAATDMVNAFLFGFGLDQLRDTVTNQSTTRLDPAKQPQPAR